MADFGAVPLIDSLADGAEARVVGGGGIEGLELILNLDFVLESDVLAVVAGVLVLGVDAAELVEECTGFVGDFVGDYIISININS